MDVLRTDDNGTLCEFTICEEIDVFRPTNNQNFNLFPNPTNGDVTLNLANFVGQQFSISIINSIGKVVKQYPEQELTKSVFHIELKSQPLANGVYYVSIVSEKEQEMLPSVFMQNE